MDAAKLIKAVSSKLLMPRLDLQGVGVCVVFSFIAPIILIIDLNYIIRPFKCYLPVFPIASPQRVSPCCVVEFNVSRDIFRFPVICGTGVVCSNLIATEEKIPVWVASFEPVFAVLCLPVGLGFILCGRCDAPQMF